MIAVKLENAIEIAKLPSQLKKGVIDAAWDDGFSAGDSSKAMALEAAVNLMDVPGAKRNNFYEIGVSTWETVQASIVGKFVMVEW